MPYGNHPYLRNYTGYSKKISYMFFPRPFGNVYELSWKSDHFWNSWHKWVKDLASFSLEIQTVSSYSWSCPNFQTRLAWDLRPVVDEDQSQFPYLIGLRPYTCSRWRLVPISGPGQPETRTLQFSTLQHILQYIQYIKSKYISNFKYINKHFTFINLFKDLALYSWEILTVSAESWSCRNFQTRSAWDLRLVVDEDQSKRISRPDRPETSDLY